MTLVWGPLGIRTVVRRPAGPKRNRRYSTRRGIAVLGADRNSAGGMREYGPCGWGSQPLIGPGDPA